MLWEGTSNINALDIVTRAVGKSRAHRTLEAALKKLLDEATPIPAAFRDRLRAALDRTLTLRRTRRRRARTGSKRAAGGQQPLSRHQRHPDDVGSSPAGPDARRALYARLVLEHRLSAQDPLEPMAGDWEREAAEILFSERQVGIGRRRRAAC